MEVDTVVSNLRAVLLSTKGGVPISKVMRDYKSIVGESIQFRKLGFDSLESFIKNVPGFRLVNVGGEILLDAVPTEKTEHVAALVANQRNGSKKSKGKPPSPFKPRTSYYQSFPKKPPSKFQRPPLAPRFAAAAKNQTSRSRLGDKNMNCGSEDKELKNTEVLVSTEEEPPDVVKHKNNDIEESSLSDQLLHLKINKQKDTKTSDLWRSSDLFESDENSVFMSRLAQLTSQIHSSHPGSDSDLAAPSKSEDDWSDVLNSRLAHFMPLTINSNIVSSPESGFQGTSNILSAQLTHLTEDMHYKNSNCDTIFNRDSSALNANEDDDDGDENNIFNKRLAHFSSKLHNKPSYDIILENNASERNGISNPNLGHFLSNNQDLRKQTLLTPGVPDYFSSALVPPQSCETTILKSRRGPFSNGNYGQVLSPDSEDIVDSHNFVKSGRGTTGNLNMQLPRSGTQITTLQNNGDVRNLQTPSPSGSHASALSESDRTSIHGFSRNALFNSSEVAGSLVSSGSVSPKSDISGALSICASLAGIRDSRSSLKTSEQLENPDQRLRNRNIFSGIDLDDLRFTPELLTNNSVSLPDLRLPEEDIWDVFVLYALSTQEIFANIIGKDYSDAFEAMAQNMELYYADCAVRTESFEIGCLYAVQKNSLWYRVRLDDIEGENCWVFLLDIGFVQMCLLSELYVLQQCFTSLPAQAICLSLFGLEDYVHEISINELLPEYDQKPFVVEVVHRDPNTSVISVYLFDVSTGKDVVINEVLKKLVA